MKKPSDGDKSPESIGDSRFIIIDHPKKYPNFYVVHPLERGNPPAWATGWGQSNAIGVFASIDTDAGSLRFIWHTDGFWFCEVPESNDMPLSEDQMRMTGAALLDDEQRVQRIQDYTAYKNSVIELENAEARRIANEEAVAAFNADLRARPEHYKRLAEESRQRMKEMEKKHGMKGELNRNR